MNHPLIDEYGIFHKTGKLLSTGYASKAGAEYEVEHRTNAGGEWVGQKPSSFVIKKV